MLKVKGVYKKIDDKNILENINFTLENNSILALIGHNGAGKSTMASILMGLEKPSGGKIFFNNIDITGLSAAKRAKMGITIGLQKDVRFEGIKIFDYLMLAFKRFRKIKSEFKKIENIEKAMQMVGLDFNLYENRVIDQNLSGGERKRVELAFFLLSRPKLVILDEPDSGIDSFSIGKIKTAILEIAKYGSVVLITHNLDLLEIANKALVLGEGRVVFNGSSKESKEYMQKNCFNCPLYR